MRTLAHAPRRTARFAWIVAASLIASGCATGHVAADPGMTAGAAVIDSGASATGGSTDTMARPASYSSRHLPTDLRAVAPIATAAGSGAFAGMAVTPREAATIAKAKHRGAKVIEISLDRYRGAKVWEVTVVSATGRWEVSVNTQTGSVARNKVDDPQRRAAHLARWKQTTVRYSAALKIALTAHPGSGLRDLELDKEHGRLVWQVELVTPQRHTYELEIDALTGKIRQDELDD